MILLDMEKPKSCKNCKLCNHIDDCAVTGADVSREVDDEVIAESCPIKAEPPTGHWIYDKSIDNWICSKCGETPKTIGYVGTADFMTEHFKFCNHCGVKMVESQAESEEV